MPLQVGALDPKRLKNVLLRWESLADDMLGDVPRFMYGTHYSTAATALYVRALSLKFQIRIPARTLLPTSFRIYPLP